MDVVVFTECPTEDYYRALFHLQKKGKVKIQFLDSRVFYLLFLKIYSSFSFLRFFGYRYFGKPLHVKKNVYLKDIFHSFLGYFSLPFTKKKIVVLFAPYHSISPYLYFLKLCQRDMVFMTSWPYWDGKRYVHSPFPFVQFFWRKFLQKMRIVTVSDTARRNLLKYSPSVVQIPHAVDLETFCPGKKKTFHVLYVGRIIPEKGIKGILDVAGELPEVSFLFVGSGSAVHLLEKCGLKNVFYLGEIRNREKLAQIFRESSVFVLNSYAIAGWEELYGIVLLEALACGTAVISTDCVGPCEIVKKEYGFLIPQKDTEALREKIEWCFMHQKELLEMGLRGRVFVEKKYDIDVLSEQWLHVLDRG